MFVGQILRSAHNISERAGDSCQAIGLYPAVFPFVGSKTSEAQLEGNYFSSFLGEVFNFGEISQRTKFISCPWMGIVLIRTLEN